MPRGGPTIGYIHRIWSASHPPRADRPCWTTAVRFARRGELERALAVALFRVPVVLEEGDIVGGARDASGQAGLVVELEAGRSHVMADAGGEVVADLALLACGELA
jgi:hypothetical protein